MEAVLFTLAIGGTVMMSMFAQALVLIHQTPTRNDSALD